MFDFFQLTLYRITISAGWRGLSLSNYKGAVLRPVLLAALFSIIFGTIIYLLWRPDTIVVFTWLDYFGLSAPIESIRVRFIHYLAIIPEWLVFSLPNGLWAYSLSAIISHLWWNTRQFVLKLAWLSTTGFVVFGYEVLQYMEVVAGVFCYQDLLLCMLGIFFGITTTAFVNRAAV